jgi:hypothetical protein
MNKQQELEFSSLVFRSIMCVFCGLENNTTSIFKTIAIVLVVCLGSLLILSGTSGTTQSTIASLLLVVSLIGFSYAWWTNSDQKTDSNIKTKPSTKNQTE